MKKGMTILGAILLVIGMGMSWMGSVLGGATRATVHLFGRSMEVTAPTIAFHDGWHITTVSEDRAVTVIHEPQLAPVQPFHAVSIDLDVGDVVVAAGDDYGVELDYWGVEYELGYIIQDDCLYVYSTTPNILPQLGYGGSAVITVPAGTTLESLYADVDVGDVTLAGLSLLNVQLDLDVGDALGEGLTVFGTVEVDADVGNVTLYGDLGETVDVDADVGNVTLGLSRSATDYWWDLTAGLGAISVDGQQVDNDRSSYFVTRGHSSFYIHVDADVGNIDVSFDQPQEALEGSYSFRTIVEDRDTVVQGTDTAIATPPLEPPTPPSVPSAPEAPTPPVTTWIGATSEE